MQQWLSAAGAEAVCLRALRLPLELLEALVNNNEASRRVSFVFPADVNSHQWQRSSCWAVPDDSGNHHQQRQAAADDVGHLRHSEIASSAALEEQYALQNGMLRCPACYAKHNGEIGRGQGVC